MPNRKINGFWLYMTEQLREVPRNHRQEVMDRVHHEWEHNLSEETKENYKRRARAMPHVPAPCPRADCARNIEERDAHHQEVRRLNLKLETATLRIR